ncbi:MAG: cyclic nucleotide-binding domain-containing protein [Dehalococcoidia bacterium]
MAPTQTETQVLTRAAVDVLARTGRKQDVAGLLTENTLLKALTDVQRAALVRGGTWATYPEVTVVSTQGSAVDAVLFIVKGRAKAEISPPARTEYRAVVNFLTPGDDIGLLSLVDGGPHSATVTAMEELQALSVPLKTMSAYLDAHPEWNKTLAEIAVARLRESGQWLQALI